MTDFSTMDSAQRQELIDKIAKVLIDNGLGDVPISTATENVAILMAGQTEFAVSCKVVKNLKSTQAEQAEKCMNEIKAITEGIKGVQVKISSQVGAGDKYQTIKDVVPVDKDEPMNLEHKQGEVWLVDFWATWCPPCQAPMAHNQKMLETNGETWGNEVRIIGYSIDQTKEAMSKHVEAKGWKKVEHYHQGKSTASDTYSIQGVPHVMLIDKEGNIAFKGHPANRQDLEADFNALRKGEKLTGEGCGAAEVAAGAEEVPEGYSEMNPATLQEDVDKASAAIKELAGDEKVKEMCKDFPRAFCVLVADQQYIPATKKTQCKYENYRVLVGPKDKLEEVKTIIDERVKGDFKVVLREQAI